MATESNDNSQNLKNEFMDLLLQAVELEKLIQQKEKVMTTFVRV